MNSGSIWQGDYVIIERQKSISGDKLMNLNIYCFYLLVNEILTKDMMIAHDLVLN